MNTLAPYHKLQESKKWNLKMEMEMEMEIEEKVVENGIEGK